MSVESMMSASTDQVEVDIDSLISSVESMMSENLMMFDKCCIFRVPSILRRHRPCAYIPNAFSIGPWHRNHPPMGSTQKIKLQRKLNNPLMVSTEKIKLQYLKNLLSRESESGVTLKELLKSTMEIEKEARSCYAAPIHVGVEDFVKLLVIDGCFLIELFRKDNNVSLRENGDPIFNMSCMMEYLLHDLILVENQIPWLVLELLFNKTAAKQPIRAQEGEPEPEKETTLAQLALQFFINIFSSKPPKTDTPYNGTKHLLDLLRNWLVKSSGNDEDVATPHDGTKHLLGRLRNCLVKSSGNDEDVATPHDGTKHLLGRLRNCLVKSSGNDEDVATPHDGTKHLLDRLRNCLVKSSGNDEDVGTGWWETMPSATDLVDAGIELKVSDGEQRSILDIKFNNGSLEMPSLLIQEETEVIFRNLISYEQCSPQCTPRITSYAVLLDNLINTTKDMDLLTGSGIINNWLNPEEATQFFNKLYHDAYLKKYYYLELCQKVNKYSRRRCPRWRALLMRNYFGTPWAIISIFAAVTLLILTLVQTIFTIIK